MFELGDIFKVEKDINFSCLSDRQKMYYREIKHEVINSFQFMKGSREDLITELEDFICKGLMPSKNNSKVLTFYQKVSSFYKSYVIYSQLVHLLINGVPDGIR